MIDEEVPQIRAACAAAAGSGAYRPHLTLLVLQKRGNQRVMPPPAALAACRGSRAADQNVPSGTCVDTSMVHPGLTEFVLISHRAIQVDSLF